MHFTSIVYTALLAIASVDAVAIAAPNALAEADPTHHVFCYRPGEACTKLKRAAEVAAEVFNERSAAPAPGVEATHSNLCNRSGEPCSKAKRNEIAIREAIAEAEAGKTSSFSSEPPRRTC